MVTKMTIIIHGGSLVGKTSLIKAAAEIYGNKKSESPQNGSGTGSTTTTSQQKNVSNMTVELGGKKYELRIVQFYDTGLTHEEQQEVMNADGFIVVYDITNKFSVERAKMYFKKITQMKQYQSQQLGTPSSSWTPPLPLILVGNKSDVPETDRKVPTTDGWKLKDANQCSAFFETSALKKRGVENVFNEIIKIVSEKKKASMAEEDEEAERKGNPLNKLFKSVPESTGGSDLDMQRELRARRLKMQAASSNSVSSPK